MSQDFNPLLYELGRDVLFGLSMMALVLVFNGLCYTRVLVWYRKMATKISAESTIGAIGLFVTSILALAIVQVFAVLIWALALFHADLIATRPMAVLFSGSCYTTIGVFEDTLPNGWKSIAIFIAFTGLFSFAWATSIMMSMANAFTQALDKSNRKKSQKEAQN